MDRATWMRFFEASPEPVQWYLLDERAIEAEDIAQEKLSYDHDAWIRIMNVVWDQVFLRIPELEFRKRLAAVAGDRDLREVERIVLRYVILPLADLVPWDVERRLQELGFALGDIQSVNRVSLRPMSYGAAVRRIAAQAKVTLLSEDVVKRARDVLMSYIKGVRMIDEVKEILQRSQPEGGVGFTLPQVEAFVTQMVDFVEKTQVISEQEYADWFSGFQRQVESDRITNRGGEQVAKVEAVANPEDMPASIFVSPQARKAQAALAEATAATYAAVGWTGTDEYLIRRLQNVISTRLRDVRNAAQAKEVLAREAKVGGMGLSPEEVERMSAIIEDECARRRASVIEEEKGKILEVQQAQEQKIAERKVRESQEHAEWFDKKVRSAQQADEARRAFFEQMRAVATGRVQKPVDANAPPPALDPVSPPVRLIGLTEELEDIGLDNFRRMARSPHDAAQKIIQQLDALKSESFERWTQGVQAWRASPLQKLYLGLVAESFRAGRSVVELIEERRKTNPDMLTAEEVGGILEVNSHAQL